MSRVSINKEDSIFNLLKPALFSIYDKDVIVSGDQDYNKVKQLSRDKEEALSREGPTGIHHKIVTILFACVLLFCFGIIFAALSNEIYDNFSLKRGDLSITLDYIAEFISKNIYETDKNIIFGILGILCGVIIPITDTVCFQSFNYNINSSNDFQSVLKCLNAILGIAMGVRHLGWTSPVQGCVAWGLLNVIMWLYFDGSRSILMWGSIISFISCGISYGTITSDDYSLLTYIMDFYFFSLLIFGKMGRYLFRYY